MPENTQNYEQLGAVVI